MKLYFSKYNGIFRNEEYRIKVSFCEDNGEELESALGKTKEDARNNLLKNLHSQMMHEYLKVSNAIQEITQLKY